MSDGYLKGGWREKYFIAKKVTNDKGDMIGITFTPEHAQYFTMRFDSDPHARVAMRAYAESISRDNEQFSEDILQQLKDSETTMGAALERALPYSDAWRPGR